MKSTYPPQNPEQLYPTEPHPRNQKLVECQPLMVEQ